MEAENLEINLEDAVDDPQDTLEKLENRITKVQL